MEPVDLGRNNVFGLHHLIDMLAVLEVTLFRLEINELVDLFIQWDRPICVPDSLLNVFVTISLFVNFELFELPPLLLFGFRPLDIALVLNQEHTGEIVCWHKRLSRDIALDRLAEETIVKSTIQASFKVLLSWCQFHRLNYSW